MKVFFLKFNLVALLFFNATFVFAQDERLDSITNFIETKIKLNQYQIAEKLIDSIKQEPIYNIKATKIRVDLSNAKLLIAQKRDEEAIAILLNGLQVKKKEKISDLAADYAYEIGALFSKAKNYSKAFKYFRLSKNYAQVIGDSIKLSKGNLGVGSVHLRIYQEYKRTFRIMDSVSMNVHKDSALHYYNIAIHSFPKLEENRVPLGTLYTNLMVFHFYEKEFDKTDKYGAISFEIFRKAKDTLGLGRAINILGASKLWQLDYIGAENYYLQGIQYFKGKTDFKSMEQRKSFLVNLSQVNGELGRFEKALKYREKAHRLTDSIYFFSVDTKVAEYESKYNFSEKEKQAEIEKNKRQKAELWLYVFGGSTVILMLFLWLVHRSQKFKAEKKALEFQKENLLHERKIEIVQNQTQIKILNATIDGKESERKQIAEILHNSVSALLSSAGLHLQAAKIELKENAPDEIEKSQSIISEAGEKIRDLSHKLISSVLLKFGLSYAMHDLCEKYSNSKLTFESNSKDIQRFSSEFEIKIHSIIEELINNIIKHSNANNANILLKQYDGRLQVRIYDDGDGFDVERMRENISSGLGLTQIEARIKMMEGIFDIKSSKETGTRIFMDVPIPESN